MTEAFKDHFSGVSRGYQAFRPHYPSALFAWLASVTPRRDRAVDLGCGTGQASVALAAHYREVIALDPSAEQIAHAEPHERVRYAVAPAEATGLPGGCADLVIAAQALHWFDPARLHAELARLARPGAVFAAFTYDLCRVTPAVDAVIDRLYRPILGPFWPPERAHVDSGYRTLPFPWPELQAPALSIEERWDLERFVGYLRTWSAVSAFTRAKGTDAIALVSDDLEAAWGARGLEREITWRLSVRAGRIGAAAHTNGSTP
ncbi:MAG TPA: class I SAM-dependent methyltransferase [Anaeromyxobacteraceae bacterium]|nr:class I SAM-dependent methyltransferase [Anaeromyxobacteraceae bacterium]